VPFSPPKTERAMLRGVWLLVVLVMAGTLGFIILGHGRRTLFDSFWMTIQILTTVGDTGMDRTYPEKLWSAGLMLVGVMAVFYLGVNVVRYVLDGELRDYLGRRQLESRISKLSDHFIVCGFGRMGKALAETLAERKATFVVIDASAERIAQAEQRDFLFVEGDAMTEEVLELARVRHARGLATCLANDADNVFVTLTARDLNRTLTIVAKANYDESHPKLRRAGADHVLSPNKLAAFRAMTKFMLPAVDELMEIVVHGSDLEVSKISLDKIPAAQARPLRELALPAKTNLMVVAVVHADGKRSFNPPPDTTLRAGDELIVIGPEGGVGKMVELFGAA